MTNEDPKAGPRLRNIGKTMEVPKIPDSKKVYIRKLTGVKYEIEIESPSLFRENEVSFFLREIDETKDKIKRKVSLQDTFYCFWEDFEETEQLVFELKATQWHGRAGSIPSNPGDVGHAYSATYAKGYSQGWNDAILKKVHALRELVEEK